MKNIENVYDIQLRKQAITECGQLQLCFKKTRKQSMKCVSGDNPHLSSSAAAQGLKIKP